MSATGPSLSAPTNLLPTPPREPSGIRLSGAQALRSRSCVFNGLRVRMGIATGKLERGQSLRSSSILERSKGERIVPQRPRKGVSCVVLRLASAPAARWCLKWCRADTTAALLSRFRPPSTAVVSDAAGGGQVLVDATTFREVKARLVELGAVDHNGLSLAKMTLSRPTLLQWLCGHSSNGEDMDAAIALDM